MGPPALRGHTGSMTCHTPSRRSAFRRSAWEPACSGESPGFTLAEVVTVLVLTGVVLGLALPLTGRALDRWAVQASRDEALALVHRTRMEARLGGGARLFITSEPAALAVFRGDSLVQAATVRVVQGGLGTDPLLLDGFRRLLRLRLPGGELLPGPVHGSVHGVRSASVRRRHR